MTTSARRKNSVSHALSQELVDGLCAQHGATFTKRDLADGIPPMNDTWVEANFTTEAERTEAQRRALAPSRKLVCEIEEADHIVIGTPIYNFSVPGSLKCWIDQVVRPGLTFMTQGDRFLGLLEGKTAHIVLVSGGTEVRGPIDYGTDYLIHVLNFIGIADVNVVAADTLLADPDTAIKTARNQIKAILSGDTICSASPRLAIVS
ncbi:FMN-dependent NADH-azoreductase [Tateyamaria sp. SN3-11]|uniref:FMN-dependent NADH-azoreductase n=1 Tax=Tateyamaria sp. SN3-11 TaxID=3092147 RepID=UPI0039EC6273